MTSKTVQIILLFLIVISLVFSLPLHAQKPTAKTFLDIGLQNSANAEYSEAVDEFKQAIKLKPNYAEAHYHLGNAYFGLRRYDEALESYRKAVQIKPDYADAHYSLGILASMLSEYDLAITSFKEVTSLDPKNSKAFFSLGNVYSEMENYEDAVIAYRTAVKIDPKNAGARYSLGVAYLQLRNDNLAAARKEYNALLKLDKDLAKDLAEKMAGRR